MTRARAAVLALAALASGCLFFVPDRSRPVPAWTAEERAVDFGCARLTARVVRSGKEGVGVAIDLAGASATCSVSVGDVELALADEVRAAKVAMPAARVAPGTRLSIYVPVAFDANAAWNRGARDARLVARGTSDGATVASAPIALRHAYEGAP